MFCTRCGATSSDAAQFCSGCGASFLVATAPPYSPAFRYSGFWKRFVAMIIDGFVFIPVAVVMLASTGAFAVIAHPQDLQGIVAAMFGVTIIAMFLMLIIGSWLYHTLMESSHYQATLGKMMLGSIVTDLNGNRISFARANGRFFGKWVSGAVFNVGYLIAAFTEKKQALHDILAGCLVIQK
jgi:uncharacterized RDD family membrane protein YckC